MRKIFVAMLFMCLTIPAYAHAAQEKMGFYVAPKLTWNYVDAGDITTSQTELATGDTDIFSDYALSDSVLGGALAIGYDFSPKFNVSVRTELEYSYFGKSNGETIFDVDEKASIDLSISTLFINAYYDFENSTKFTPYVGAGLGIAWVGYEEYQTAGSLALTAGKDTDTNFAWNVAVGVAYDFNETISLDLGYRYSQLGDARTQTATFNDGSGDFTYASKTDTVDTHQIMLGLRFTF